MANSRLVTSLLSQQHLKFLSSPTLFRDAGWRDLPSFIACTCRPISSCCCCYSNASCGH